MVGRPEHRGEVSVRSSGEFCGWRHKLLRFLVKAKVLAVVSWTPEIRSHQVFSTIVVVKEATWMPCKPVAQRPMSIWSAASTRMRISVEPEVDEGNQLFPVADKGKDDPADITPEPQVEQGANARGPNIQIGVNVDGEATDNALLN